MRPNDSLSVAPTGDGLANGGEIIATGRDLETVKRRGDPGKIVAGNNALPARGIKSLTIDSSGVFDCATQPSGSNLPPTITGSVPAITVLGAGGPATAGSMIINRSVLQSRISIGADGRTGNRRDAIDPASVLSKLVPRGTISGTVGGMDWSGIHGGKITKATINGNACRSPLVCKHLSLIQAAMFSYATRF